MGRKLVYSCVFFNENYINLIELLLKSYIFFGNPREDTDYLVICNPDFKSKIQGIFDKLRIKGKIWCLNLKTIFEAGYSRLKIFDYNEIDLYEKILYLDCDILVTNSIENMFNFELENKLYVLKEPGHRDFHCIFFSDEEYKNLDKNKTFTSGILLFNNDDVIKDLFSQILLHIDNHISNALPVPDCLDQPFIVYQAIKKNLYDNQKISNLAINNPNTNWCQEDIKNNFYGQTICHFPGGPGKYQRKITNMRNFMNTFFNKYICNSIYVGSSNHNHKEIILHDNIDINNIKINNNPINKQGKKWKDTFSTKIIDNKLIVSRIDKNSGWGQNLVLSYQDLQDGLRNKKFIPEIIPKINLINNCQEPCKKNTTFPLIGICVSYNYMDTLKFMLPINYNHFDKLYLVTQEDDIETVEFCKKFTNVEVLFFNFETKVAKFDKGGALKLAQKIAYKKYPHHWYLIIDSDIVLPNNFIDILEKEKLNEDCIYGGIRNNIVTSSKVSNFFNNKLDIDMHTKMLEKISDHVFFLIIGSFQLYKKKNFYVESDDNYYVIQYKNKDFKGADHDLLFAENFEYKCCLNNVIYLHLGEGDNKKLNWLGKKYYFEDDCNINLDQIYFNCNIKNKNIYYNKEGKIVDIFNKSINMDEDIWTCSDEFRKDIKDFFKDKPKYKIAEIGSHKGYTSRYLSDIFEKVYCVDNSVELTNFNKNLNKDKNNIEYVHLDVYQDSWNIIPDVDVVFIDALHGYEECKSDLYNSLENFPSLKYIIFDDYGVCPGVKEIVDESLKNTVINFEKYIGLNNIPALENKIFKNTSEGIICNTETPYTKIINKKYTWQNEYIKFEKNYQMRAFGKGKYFFIDEYIAECNFQGRKYMLKFNKDYSSFISIREGDFETVFGTKI